MDEDSDRPIPEVPARPDVPPPVPEPTKRRRPVVIGIVVGAIGMFVALSVIGYLTSSTRFEIPLEEDFSSGEPKFTTDSDRLAEFSVADGEYHILIKDASAPQLARHIFDHTYDGLRFEATVTMPESRNALFSVGCWTGQSAYLFVLSGSGEVGLVETVNESTGERIALTDVIMADAVLPPGEPNRLRIDCVGGGSEPTIVSGWVNGEPIVSVSVPEGNDSFSAVGFFLGSETDGAEFVVDDVVAAAERPAPGKSPVPPVVATEQETPRGFVTPTLVSTPEDVLRRCLAATLVNTACPRLVLDVDAGYFVKTWSTAAGPESGAGWKTLAMSYGVPYQGIRRKNAPPRFAHLVIRAGDLSRAFPFSFPGPAEPAQEITKRPARFRENVIPLGRFRWGGKTGTLILSPPYPNDRFPGDHLVFRWRDDGIDYEISLHAWVPLDLARSMLESIVKSID